jgi:hypothetical protein
MSEARPAAQLPEVGRFWIRYAPKAWEAAERPWIHLGGAVLGDWAKGKARAVESAVPAATPLDDVLYFPPVPPRRSAARDELARERLMAGSSICSPPCSNATLGLCGVSPPAPRRRGRCSPA